MKIEIDLKDILFDEEYGPETMQESIKRQVVENIQKTMAKGIQSKIDIEVAKAIDEQIKKALDEIRPSLITEILDAKYKPVDRYGNRESKETTFREQLIKVVLEEMKYEKKHYSSDRNPFTRAVDEVLESQVGHFQKQFKTIIDEHYIKQTKEYAVKVLKEKLGFN